MRKFKQLLSEKIQSVDRVIVWRFAPEKFNQYKSFFSSEANSFEEYTKLTDELEERAVESGKQIVAFRGSPRAVFDKLLGEGKSVTPANVSKAITEMCS